MNGVARRPQFKRRLPINLNAVALFGRRSYTWYEVQEFGGGWTELKLGALRDYFKPYLLIIKKYGFRAIYLDGFAGSGRRYGRDNQSLFPEFSEVDADGFAKGSPRLAVELDPHFDQYVFIEKDAEYVQELLKLKSEFPSREVSVERAEANQFIKGWVPTLGRYDRALVFLDPYGMQVEWATIEAIAKSQKIDMWLLFPLGQGVIRLLTKREPPPNWEATLTRFFGKDEWKEHFYSVVRTDTLFGAEDEVTRDVDYKRISDFFVTRLKSVFADAIESPIVLKNSRGTPLYLLCFAVGNPKGAPTAIKIAKSIARKFNDGRK